MFHKRLADSLKKLLIQRTFTTLGAALHRGPSIVLCYHDLRSKDGFSSWLRCSREDFNDHLDALSSLGDFLHPQQFFSGSDRTDSRIRFLVTFDDGYVNNYRIGLPLLQEHGVPAVFFVSTRHLVEGGHFWHDRIIGPIQAMGVERLDLRKAGLDLYCFPHDDADARWTQIQRLLEDIKSIGNNEHPTVSRVLDHINGIAGEEWQEEKEDCRPINTAELREMATSPWCHFGAHGHDHKILTRMERQVIAYNLATSKLIMEKVTGRTIDLFSYPNGDFNAVVKEELNKAGYRAAFTTSGGIYRPSTSQYAIPRLLVGGYDKVSDLMRNINRILLLGTVRG